MDISEKMCYDHLCQTCREAWTESHGSHGDSRVAFTDKSEVKNIVFCFLFIFLQSKIGKSCTPVILFHTTIHLDGTQCVIETYQESSMHLFKKLLWSLGGTILLFSNLGAAPQGEIADLQLPLLNIPSMPKSTNTLWQLLPSAEGKSLQSIPESYDLPLTAKELPRKRYKLKSLSNEEFASLPYDQRLKVVHKLYSTLFYGTSGSQIKKAASSATFIDDTFQMFETPNSIDELQNVEETLAYYYNDEYGKGLLSHLIARLYHLTPGKEYFNRWAAYILTQTILFSPAYELDTVYTIDAINVYNRLVRGFDGHASLQWSTFSHMISSENWRRFRSPEDNGREMLEIFLLDFNDSHVPLAAKALKNWRLDRYSNTLVIELNGNTKPIRKLFPGYKVVDGYDFYSTLIRQPSFLEGISRRLVDLFFPDKSERRKEALSKQLASSHPRTWQGLLKQIIFSRTYLLDSSKTKSFEETFFSSAKALRWRPKYYSFYNLASYQDKMHQSLMKYKLGRKTSVPLDTQSFAWYHKIIRENILLNSMTDPSDESGDDGWYKEALFRRLPSKLISKREFDRNGNRTLLWFKNEKKRADYIIDDLFIRIVGRKASKAEKNMLSSLIDNLKYDRTYYNIPSWIDLYGQGVHEDRTNRGAFAEAVLDYLSRLSELYEYTPLSDDETK